MQNSNPKMTIGTRQIRFMVGTEQLLRQKSRFMLSDVFSDVPGISLDQKCFLRGMVELFHILQERGDVFPSNYSIKMVMVQMQESSSLHLCHHHRHHS